MSAALSSFLISVSIILAMALFVPCVESLIKAFRRGQPKQQLDDSQSESAESFGSETA